MLALTCPKRVGRRAALDWAQRQSEWVDAQVARIEPGEPFHPGAFIPWLGARLLLEWREDFPRTPQLSAETLRCGGPLSSFSSRIERFLRSKARELLSSETARVAEEAGVAVRSVAVGDASSRWGSCSESGSIRYNWRLILAPPHLLRWVVAHEVAHRRHMNHGPAFRALEAQLFAGDVAAARAEMRALGPRLKRVGRPI